MEEIIIIEDLEPEEIVLLEEQVEYIKPTGEKEITANGIYDVTDYSSANVNVPAPAPDLEDLTITPTTSEQIFNHPNKDGYDEVVVNGVTNSIDSNIQAENIKKDVSILGITGTLEAPDLNEYFNMTPTASDLSNTQYWMANNYLKKVGDLIIPDAITDLSYLCAFDTMNVLKYCPRIVCGNQVTSLFRLYYYNASENIDLTGLDTSNVTKINYMFYRGNFKKMDLSVLDFSNISSNSSDYDSVISNCYNVEEIKVPSTYKRPLRNWFQRDYSLKTLVLLRDDGISEYNSSFRDCYHMDGTVNATYNPEGLKDGRIYVPDNLVNSYKTASGWSTYADQILPLSQYVEE